MRTYSLNCEDFFNGCEKKNFFKLKTLHLLCTSCWFLLFFKSNQSEENETESKIHHNVLLFCSTRQPCMKNFVPCIAALLLFIRLLATFLGTERTHIGTWSTSSTSQFLSDLLKFNRHFDRWHRHNPEAIHYHATTIAHTQLNCLAEWLVATSIRSSCEILRCCQFMPKQQRKRSPSFNSVHWLFKYTHSFNWNYLWIHFSKY